MRPLWKPPPPRRRRGGNGKVFCGGSLKSTLIFRVSVSLRDQSADWSWQSVLLLAGSTASGCCRGRVSRPGGGVYHFRAFLLQWVRALPGALLSCPGKKVSKEAGQGVAQRIGIIGCLWRPHLEKSYGPIAPPLEPPAASPEVQRINSGLRVQRTLMVTLRKGQATPVRNRGANLRFEYAKKLLTREKTCARIPG